MTPCLALCCLLHFIHSSYRPKVALGKTAQSRAADLFLRPNVSGKIGANFRHSCAVSYWPHRNSAAGLAIETANRVHSNGKASHLKSRTDPRRARCSYSNNTAIGRVRNPCEKTRVKYEQKFACVYWRDIIEYTVVGQSNGFS